MRKLRIEEVETAQGYKARKWQSHTQLSTQCTLPFPPAAITCTGQEPSTPLLITESISALASERSYFLDNLHPVDCYPSFRARLASSFQETFLDCPSLILCLFSGFPQPWARVLCPTVLISTCHTALSCSRSWAISYSILELQSFVEHLCEAGIKSVVLVGRTND